MTSAAQMKWLLLALLLAGLAAVFLLYRSPLLEIHLSAWSLC
jgi:hypothetical protein